MTDQKHTKEPWDFVQGTSYNEVDIIHHDMSAGAIGKIAKVNCRKTWFDEGQANAKRIVECVNACAGIENPLDLRRERDELREALEYCLPIVKAFKIPAVQKMVEDILTKTKGAV